MLLLVTSIIFHVHRHASKTVLCARNIVYEKLEFRKAYPVSPNCSNAPFSKNRYITWISEGFDIRIRLHEDVFLLSVYSCVTKILLFCFSKCMNIDNQIRHLPYVKPNFVTKDIFVEKSCFNQSSLRLITSPYHDWFRRLEQYWSTKTFSQQYAYTHTLVWLYHQSLHLVE